MYAFVSLKILFVDEMVISQLALLFQAYLN